MLNPQELDSQSVIKIDRWIDIESEECKNLDENYSLSKKWMKMLMESNYLKSDSLGRLWCHSENGNFFPYHFEVGTKLYGFRLSKVAAN